MAEKANVIVKFMLSARKRRGIYFFSATIFIITIFLFFLSVILYEQHLPGRRLALLFVLMGILLFGSPICFSIRALDCSFKELYAVIISRYQAIRGVNAVIVSD